MSNGQCKHDGAKTVFDERSHERICDLCGIRVEEVWRGVHQAAWIEGLEQSAKDAAKNERERILRQLEEMEKEWDEQFICNVIDQIKEGAPKE